jgi:hypothetical protein
MYLLAKYKIIKLIIQLLDSKIDLILLLILNQIVRFYNEFGIF